MRILCLVDWPVLGRWLWDYLPESGHQVDFVTIRAPRDRFPGYGKLLSYYPAYLWLGVKSWTRVRDYDLVVTWEGKNGVPLAFLRRLMGPPHPPLVILNFVLKGQVVLDFLWLIRLALSSVDHVAVVSQREVAYYSEVLRIPVARFTALLTVWPDYHNEDREWDSRGYILAAGRSHRDYATLIEAVRGMPLRVIITARSFNVRGLEPPPNVTFSPFVPWPDFLELVRGADFVVLPLFEAKHASGETFLLEAMAARKAVIATETFSTTDFIRPGDNGLLVPPGNAEALRCAIESLAGAPQRAREMGMAGRRFYEDNCSMPAYARRVDALLRRVAGPAAKQ